MTEPKVRIFGCELLDPKALIPHPDNPNEHTLEQIEALAEIILFQGWRRPITVSKRSGFITSGHGRRLSAMAKGWLVPVSYQDYDSEEQEYADLVADNAIDDWAILDLRKIQAKVPLLGPDFNQKLLGIKKFAEKVAEQVKDVNFQTKPKSIFEVVVDCMDEMDQRQVYEELTKMGMKCRVLSM